VFTFPVGVPGLPNGRNAIDAISAGFDYTCAIVRQWVKCWGLNDHGQLGNGTTISSYVPVDVVGIPSGSLGIYAGGQHICALTWVPGGGPNRDVRCWGDNRYGQLGDGSTVDSSVPVKVAGISSDAFASGVAVGGAHTCASTDNGVVCWGRNVDGQLGDGTTIDSRSPVMVSGIAGYAPIDAAPFGDHTCALTGGFGVKCWGKNDFGQLGDGTTISSSVPVDVDLRIHPKIGLWSSVPSGTIDQGTTVRFTATVRPLDPSGVRPVVRFVISRQDEDGTWRSAGSRDVTADATGRARLRWGFVTPGPRRVVARVLPDTAYAASPRSLPVNYTVRPEPTLPVEVAMPTWWSHRGDRVSVTARTRPGARCTLSLQWVNSGASGPIPTEPATIGTRTANAEGIARWGWTVNAPRDNDEAWVTVTCRDGDLSGDGVTAFWVVPSGFEPSATLPPELLGTWVLGPSKDRDTFVIGPCSLGERCGSLIEADQPGCRYPLVFHRNSAPGDFILDAREDDTAGCDERWGLGLHFVPTAEGTVRLYTRDGTNVILHRVGPAPTTVP
jgi:hypothetical protein